MLFAYLHLAPDPEQTRDLLASGVTAIAYETVTDRAGGLPLLAPMSEVAGRLAPQVGAWTLQKANGGRGVLLGGVPGVAPGRVAVIGGGVVGTHAARVAAGMGADVVVLDASLTRMRHLDESFGGVFRTVYASRGATEEAVAAADLVIGAVLVPGAAAPKLVSRAQLGLMKPGAAIVDVAIDQGGCFETSRPTTHDDPIYIVDGILHYCVANMPGAVARTSTHRPRQRDDAVPAGAGRQGLAAGLRGGPAPAGGTERPCRAADLRCGGAGARDRRAGAEAGAEALIRARGAAAAARRGP